MPHIVMDKFRYVNNAELRKMGYKARSDMAYQRGNEFSFETRCRICGKWCRYDYKQKQEMIKNGRWDVKMDKMRHCGDSGCYDWAKEEDDIRDRRMRENTDSCMNMFMKLLKAGLVP